MNLARREKLLVGTAPISCHQWQEIGRESLTNEQWNELRRAVGDELVETGFACS